jgi:hypothetical protein
MHTFGRLERANHKPSVIKSYFMNEQINPVRQNNRQVNGGTKQHKEIQGRKKMDAKQAIEFMNQRRLDCIVHGGIETAFAKHYDLAISALSKQVPMKPVRVNIGRTESITDGCPVCGWHFFDAKPYCMSCGQKIDWD